MTDSTVSALTSSRERTAYTTSGYIMLLVLLLAIMVQLWGIVGLATDNFTMARIVGVIVGPIVLIFVACGFYMLQPNQAAAITLFGDYKGTDRTSGLRWVLPWMIRKKVSVRANNFISDRIKVNDLRGNPIEMAAQIVWRVVDTAQALFDVSDYDQFVKVQVESAIRTIGSRFPMTISSIWRSLCAAITTRSGQSSAPSFMPGSRSPESRSTNAASPTLLMRRKSPARCFAASRRKRWSRRARRWSRARSGWSKWRSRC